MKRFFLLPLIALVLVFSISLPVAAQSPAGPPAGWQAHPPIHARPYASTLPQGYSPSKIRTAYGFDQINSDGTGQTIAIVDAFDDPTVESDLQVFNTQFGLPAMNTSEGPTFTKVYAQGRKPRTDSGWALEISLDVQWAHAIAPGANILLVEAATNSFSNLLGAVDKAVSMGAEVISMSWGGSEFSGESIYDYHFNKLGVVFTASSGDGGAGVIYPAVSPYVLGIGGTNLNLDSSGGYGTETAWSGSGGGISSYYTKPGYQSTFQSYANRGVPDVSYDADPYTGFAVYDSTSYQGQSGWWQVGGTSAGAPQWAALVAIADQGLSKSLSTSDLTSSPFYNAATGANYAANYRDITSGSNGYNAITGYDLVTGLGSPIANKLVPFFMGGSSGSKANSSTSISLNSSSITLDQSVTAAATVTGIDSTVTPTGTVQFQYQIPGTSTWNNLGTLVTLDASSKATSISYQPPTTGTYYFQAVYNGDTNYNGSTSSTETLTVTNTSNSSLSVAVSTNKGAYKAGDQAIITVTVTSGGSPVNNASVTVNIIDSSGSTISTLTDNTGASDTILFSFDTSNLNKGPYTVTATAYATGYTTGSGSTKFRIH